MGGALLAACGPKGGGGGGSVPLKDYPLTAADDALNYELLADKSGYAVTGMIDPNSAAAVTVPDQINDLAVTKIDAGAFWQAKLTSVSVGANVKEIGGKAFYACQDLTSVALPQSLETLSSVTEDGVTDFKTFWNCTALTEVSFADGCRLREIPAYAFQNTKLTSVRIPAAVTTIGDYAFNLVNADGTFA